jgi:excisionase family DNA binding protein
MNNIELLTIPEMAKLLKISRSKAYSMSKEKGFPIIKIGKSLRILKDELLKWLHV